jgi:very-short-patch-repair endonuclease
MRSLCTAPGDALLRSRGMMVIRVMNDDVLRDLDAVCELILREAEREKTDINQPRDPLTP